MSQQLAHVYSERNGPLGWPARARAGLEGYDPAVSIYDAPFAPSDTILARLGNGMVTLMKRLPLSAPTTTRKARVSAQHSTLPAARFFNAFGNASGTGQSFSPMAVAQGQRMLRLGWNPNMQGAAELHPATSYDPFPSPGSLYPKVV